MFHVLTSCQAVILHPQVDVLRDGTLQLSFKEYLWRVVSKMFSAIYFSVWVSNARFDLHVVFFCSIISVNVQFSKLTLKSLLALPSKTVVVSAIRWLILNLSREFWNSCESIIFKYPSTVLAKIYLTKSCLLSLVCVGDSLNFDFLWVGANRV